MPSPGDGQHVLLSRRVGYDTHLYQDYPIPPRHNSLIARRIARAKSREACIWMQRALGEFVVEGIKTAIAIAFHKVLEHECFAKGQC